MASSRSEESDAVNTHTSRQKRGLSFTGMLRDSLSLLVPTFVLDATTPKRRRVQEELSVNSLSEDKSNQTQQSCQPFNFSSNLQTCTSTPTGTDTSSNQQNIQQSITSLYPSLASFREGGLEERVSTPDVQFKRHQHSSFPLRASETHILTNNLPQEPPHLNSAKRSRLNDSHIPTSSFSAWTHTSGSSSSGSMLGETYHQSPFYPGKTTYGGASNYRRDALRGRLNVGKRTQTTVVPLRLNSVISQSSPAADDLSDVASTSSESGPILSAATRRILRAMRRGTDSTQDIAARDTFGTTARSTRNQRHSLWTSCVRRRGVNTHKSKAPPTVELRRFPPSSHEANIFSPSSWPRDAIGVPPVNSNTGNKQDRLPSTEIKGTTSDFDKQLQRAVGVLTSYSFSSPAIRSQPSTRPPSNASSDVSRPNFIFQSPPSRSASSTTLADIAPLSNPSIKSSGSVNFANDITNNPEATAIGRHDVSKKTDYKSLCFQSMTPSDSQSSPAPFLFSGSRTLPELRPSFDSLPVSKSFPNQISLSSKRTLPQESWRCEACLAENAFLVTSCRVCQRVPSNTIVASQRKWHSESTEPLSQTEKNPIASQRKEISNDELSVTGVEKSNVIPEKVNIDKTNLPSLTTSSKLKNWRCETCLVENPDTSESCVCCQSSKPKPETSKPMTSNVVTKWRCETCLVENPETSESCVCCQSSKPKPKTVEKEKSVSCSTSKVKSKEANDNSSFQDKKNNKWRCDTCLVENDELKTKCVCCESPKPTIGPRPSGNLSKSSSNETWRCDACLVENGISSIKCVCCENPKPNASGSSSKGTSEIIASGGLLSSWKSSSETKFSFGTVASNNALTDNKNSDSKSTIKFGFDNHQKMNNNGSIEIPGNVFKFGSGNIGSTSSANADKVSFSFGNSNVSGCLSQGKLTEQTNPITNIKFGGTSQGDKNTEDNSKPAASSGFVFGNKDKTGGFQITENSENSTFVFGNAKPELKIGNTKASNDIRQDNSTQPNICDKVASNKQAQFTFGSKDDKVDSVPTESTSDKENPDKIAINQNKSYFGGFKVAGFGNDILSHPQPRLGTSMGNNSKSPFQTPVVPVVTCVSNVTSKEEQKTLPNIVSSAEKSNAPSNTQTSLFGSNDNNGKTPLFGTTPAAPSSTSIESLFSNSGPKMSFKSASDVPQFGTQSTAIKFRTPEGSQMENSKQKKLTSSISSPTLMSLPVTSSNNTVPSFSFGKTSTMSIDTPAFSDMFGAGNNKTTSNTFIFGGSNSEKQSVFPTQPMRETGSALSNPPVTTFTGVNQSSSTGFLANGPSSNSAPNMFPTGQLSFGSSTGSQQPFVFGSSALGGSSITDTPVPAQAPAPSVPCSFQFGNQTPGQQAPFLFGNNSNPTTNSAGSTNSFGAPAANPFSSQGSVTASNPNRPIKKAHRRLRK